MIVKPTLHTTLAPARAAAAHRKDHGCEFKRQYPSRKDAAFNASKQSRVSGELIRAYHCAFHHCFHIGHPPPERGSIGEVSQ